MHLVFLSIIWQLWLGRNKHIFYGITLCADRIVAAAKSDSLQLHAAFWGDNKDSKDPGTVSRSALPSEYTLIYLSASLPALAESKSNGQELPLFLG